MIVPPARARRLLAGTLAAVAVATGVVAGLAALDRAFPPRTAPPEAFSVRVVDREGRLLRAFTTPGGRWRLPVRLSEVDPRFPALLAAYEDRRFRAHAGVDPLAVARAAWQAVREGRIVSGASTLTMQTVRLMSGERERTLGRKLVEMVRALQLERRLSKDEILERYLALAPYGGNLEGIRAASLAWFGREPARLTLAQMALLIALPQSPEARRPDRKPEAARRARDRVLDRLVAVGAVSAAEAAAARTRPVPTARRPVPMLAPHLARRVVAERPERTLHRLTIDGRLQADLERLARESAAAIDPDVSAAILVADHATGEVLAHVGSADFLSARRAGHVDMVAAVRSPGSALKPFVYGLAFELGLARPGTLLVDAPTRFGGYEPENFDDVFHGEVTATEALRRSLNVPAVALLEAVGPTRLAVRLAGAGADLVLPETEAPSIAVGLGGLGARLADLVVLYGGLANDGTARPLRHRRAHAAGEVREDMTERAGGRTLVEPEAARAVTAILRGTPPPRNAARDRLAYKTGTSWGHRDAWAVGYDGRRVVGVWIGRPDGAPVPALTGWLDAAPLLFAAFSRIAPETVPFDHPPDLVPTAALPPPLRRFGPARGSTGEAIAGSARVRIAHPVDGATVALGVSDGGSARLAVRAISPVGDLTWLLDGRPVPTDPFRRDAALPVRAPGPLRITVIAPDGASDSVVVTVE